MFQKDTCTFHFKMLTMLLENVSSQLVNQLVSFEEESHVDHASLELTV